MRALGERSLVGDGGVQTSVELWLPPTSQGLRWLAFYDQGRVKTLEPALGFVSYESVGSLGFGMRWQYQSSLSVALDYAQVIQGHDPSATPRSAQNVRGHNRLHVNMVLRF